MTPLDEAKQYPDQHNNKSDVDDENDDGGKQSNSVLNVLSKFKCRDGDDSGVAIESKVQTLEPKVQHFGADSIKCRSSG